MRTYSRVVRGQLRFKFASQTLVDPYGFEGKQYSCVVGRGLAPAVCYTHKSKPSSERKVARESVTEGACATMSENEIYYTRALPQSLCDSSLPEGAFGWCEHRCGGR